MLSQSRLVLIYRLHLQFHPIGMLQIILDLVQVLGTDSSPRSPMDVSAGVVGSDTISGSPAEGSDA